MFLPNSMQYFSTLPLLYRLYQHCMVKFFHCMVKFFHCMVKFFHCMVIYLNSLQILREILCITTSDAFALQIMLFNKSCCILEALFISAQHFLSFVVFKLDRFNYHFWIPGEILSEILVRTIFSCY